MSNPANALAAKPDDKYTQALFIQAFMKGTTHTLSVQCSYQVQAQPLSLFAPNAQLPADICGVIGLVSSVFVGSVSICFPKKVFLDIVGGMFGETYPEITDELSDGAGELLNIIFGTAKTELTNVGFRVDKAIPTIMRGDNISLRTVVPGGKTILVPFTHGSEKFHMLIGLGEVK